MHRLIYQSSATLGLSLEAVEDLARRSGEKNKRLGLTGILLCDGLTYCQVLEGARAEIDALWSEIKRDKRHSNISVVSNRPITARMFPHFSMKLIDRIDLFELLGLLRRSAPNSGFADVVKGLHGWRVSDEALSKWPSVYEDEPARSA